MHDWKQPARLPTCRNLGERRPWHGVGRKYPLHGRDPKRVARVGYTGSRRSRPARASIAGWIWRRTLAPSDAAGRSGKTESSGWGDALPNIMLVGAIAQPAEISDNYGDLVLTAESVKGTAKPTMAWIRRRQEWHGMFWRFIARWRERKGVAVMLDHRGLPGADQPAATARRWTGDTWREFAAAGQPVSVGPMTLVSGTGPATLAGTLAQENAWRW